MALQSSGAISLNDIHQEVGGTSGTQVSLNDADVRALIGKASGAQSSFSEFYGASSFDADTNQLVYLRNYSSSNTTYNFGYYYASSSSGGKNPVITTTKDYGFRTVSTGSVFQQYFLSTSSQTLNNIESLISRMGITLYHTPSGQSNYSGSVSLTDVLYTTGFPLGRSQIVYGHDKDDSQTNLDARHNMRLRLALDVGTTQLAAPFRIGMNGIPKNVWAFKGTGYDGGWSTQSRDITVGSGPSQTTSRYYEYNFGAGTSAKIKVYMDTSDMATGYSINGNYWVHLGIYFPSGNNTNGISNGPTSSFNSGSASSATDDCGFNFTSFAQPSDYFYFNSTSANFGYCDVASDGTISNNGTASSGSWG